MQTCACPVNVQTCACPDLFFHLCIKVVETQLFWLSKLGALVVNTDKVFRFYRICLMKCLIQETVWELSNWGNVQLGRYPVGRRSVGELSSRETVRNPILLITSRKDTFITWSKNFSHFWFFTSGTNLLSS